MDQLTKLAKPWLCQKRTGHILGQVVRNGSNVSELVLYRHALDPLDPAEPEVLAVLQGYGHTVQCDLCGAIRDWFPDAAALEKLVENWQRIRRTD